MGLVGESNEKESGESMRTWHVPNGVLVYLGSVVYTTGGSQRKGWKEVKEKVERVTTQTKTLPSLLQPFLVTVINCSSHSGGPSIEDAVKDVEKENFTGPLSALNCMHPEAPRTDIN